MKRLLRAAVQETALSSGGCAENYNRIRVSYSDVCPYRAGANLPGYRYVVKLSYFDSLTNGILREPSINSNENFNIVTYILR